MTLNQLINKQVLPRLLWVVLSLLALVLAIVFHYAQLELEKRHQGYINSINDSLISALDDGAQQISNLASNDLVINSLVDVSQRDNYLPLFFQSLKISNIDGMSIAFFDFTGEMIISKNWQEYAKVSPDFNWSQAVLVDSKTYKAFSEQGVLIAAPVLLGEMAEGAIVLFNDSVQEVLIHNTKSGVQLMVSKPDNQILFSSSPSIYSPKTTFNVADDALGYSLVQEFDDYLIVSMEPAQTAYSRLIAVFVVALLSVTAIFIISLYSTRLAVRHAASTLQSLNQEIANLISGQEDKCHEEERQAQELQDIKQSFQILIEKWVRATLSKDKVSGVLNSMSEMVLVLDIEGDVAFQNDAFTDFENKLDLDASEITNILPQQLLDKSTAGDVEHEKHYTFSNSIAPMCVLWHTTDFTDREGERIGTVFVGEDVTQKRALQADLMMKTQAIDEAKTSIVISDISKPGQPIVYVNKAYQVLTGFTYDEIIGGNCKLLQGKDTSTDDVNKIRKAIQHRQSIDITLLNYRKNGSAFFNRLTLTPIHNADDSVTHYIGIQQDVTNEEKAAKYLRDAKQRAEESARLKSEFLASMSHEIRTPINGISGMLQLLQSSDLDDKQREFADLAKQSSDNLLHIINDILDFSKIEAGKLSIESTEFNLCRLIKLTRDHFKIEISQSDLTFNVDSQIDDSLHVIGDPVRIRQVISNLLSNAIKFTEQGEITLRTRLIPWKDGTLNFRCAISDTGIGIAKEKLEHIFETFTQEDASTSREFGGTGLGLSICKQLCELLGGSISAESTKDKGSTFSFELPLTPVKIPSHQHTAAPLSDDSKTSDAFFDVNTVPVILLVEDNEINQVVAKNQLEQYRVLVANNGKEALTILSQLGKKIDIIVMDCQMPVMDGYEATMRIRKGEAGEEVSATPVIALTANAMVGDKEKCIEAGMNDYLSKPFSSEDLNAMVKKWLISRGRLNRSIAN